MPIVRIVAVSKEGGHTYKDYRIMLVCHIKIRTSAFLKESGLDASNSILSHTRSYSKVETDYFTDIKKIRSSLPILEVALL